MPHSMRVAAVCVTTVAATALLSLVLGTPGRPTSDVLASLPPDLSAACAGDNPYLVTVCYRGGASAAVMAREPAVVAFRDTASDAPHFELATQEQVGAVYGLAYSARESALYAAAFHKRQIPFGPGGPGAVYRIDLSSGDVVHLLTVPNAGPDRHASGRDFRGEPYAGKTSLGDIDLGADGSELHVVNLEDRQIYRFRLPDGEMVGSFAHGASGEPWADEARPFGLAVRNGRVYHAVVRTAESSGQRADLALYVYESAPDGSGMRRVAEAALDYERGSLNPLVHSGNRDVLADWLPWTDRPSNRIADPRANYAFVHPMPMGSDIAFGPEGHLVVGLRDRIVDMKPVFWDDSFADRTKADPSGFGAGDIVRGAAQPGGWRIETAPEHFNDDFRFNDEPTLGGLAALGDSGTIASNGWGDNDRLDLTVFGEAPSVLWFDAAGGGKVRFEAVCRAYGPQPQLALDVIGRAWADNEGPGFAGSTGDVEVLCGDVVTPTATLSATPTPSAVPTVPPTMQPPPSPTITPAASSMPSPSRTPTAGATTTPTVTPVPLPRYLPMALAERCDPEHKRADVAVVIDTSSSMAGQKLEDAKAAAVLFVGLMDLMPGRDQVAVVRYDTEAEIACGLTSEQTAVDAAIRNLAPRSGTHIDEGLRKALKELQSERRNERNLPVMVLLTDGVQTGTPGEELRAAAEVRDAGVRLYAIGLGADVDAATLREMAGDAARYRFAPDSADLARIYAEIAGDITCPAPAGGFWPGR